MVITLDTFKQGEKAFPTKKMLFVGGRKIRKHKIKLFCGTDQTRLRFGVGTKKIVGKEAIQRRDCVESKAKSSLAVSSSWNSVSPCDRTLFEFSCCAFLFY